MEKKISDMMDYIQDDSVQLRIRTIASSEKIKEVTMAKLHTNTKTYGRAHRVYRVPLIAAVIVMLLCVSAFAVWNFGLKDMRGGDSQTLTMNGLSGTAEYEAAQEWERCLKEMAASGKNELSPDSAEGFEPDVYFWYNAISREAKDELDALLKEYGLRMHGSRTETHSMDELYNAAGAEGFMPEPGDNGEGPVGGAYYDDGTFTLNCAAVLPDGTNVRYQFYSLTKGTFTRLGYLMADADDYEEWTYTTGEGAQVLLATSANKSIMAADLDNCFVFVNILSGTENNSGHALGAQPVNKESLESFAESFDFTMIDSLSA